MWKRISLRSRIYLILSALMLITLTGGLVMVWSTYQMQKILSGIIDRHLAAFQSAEALQISLVNQKGFVSYYFMDGDPEWLRRLGEYRQIFMQRFQEVKSLADSDYQMKAIDRIDKEYKEYIDLKDRVIRLYQTGQKEIGTMVHREARDSFFKALEQCDQYKKLHADRIQEARTRSFSQARNLRLVAFSAMSLFFVLALLLIFVLVGQILGPVRRMALEADRMGEAPPAEDEVKALGRRVRGLIEDIDLTHFELEKSRENLLQAEKMALVGKLAAGVAHSIRNPLTSVKMRLFSLGRTLVLSSSQKEDFGVISEEIRHIDTIVQNFLEFSRPPKLKMQSVSPSEIVDLVIQLLKYRLESYNVEVGISRKAPLSEVQADPEQLKEVLINLMVNACEAMERGGKILIDEKEGYFDSLGRAAVIRMADSGPGIPEAIREKVFDPFYTTKEEGTGLGLSIALRIIKEHGGRLTLVSDGGQGATFEILLPIDRR